MSNAERQRETFEKILLAKTIPEKIEIVEKELIGEEQLKLKFWYKLAQNKPIKSWTKAEQEEFEKWNQRSSNKSNLENIDLLLRYELADTEPKQKEILEEMKKKIGLSQDDFESYSKPYNHEYAGRKDAGNTEEDSNSEEEEKKEAAPSTEATLPADFSV